jgi:septal ring factor EnvC (AmiA/AmiB activator)
LSTYQPGLLRRVAEQKQTIKQLNAAAASKATLRDQRDAARSALDALSTENAKLRDENAILRDDNISLRRTRTKRAREKEELDAELACLRDENEKLRAREASGAADEPEAAARTVTPGAPVVDCDEAASALEGYAGSMPSPPTRGGGGP